MTTEVEVKMNDVERRILSELILYKLGILDRNIQSGESAPNYAHRKNLAEIYLHLQEPGNITMGDSHQISIMEIQDLFECFIFEKESTEHLLSGGWASNQDFGACLILSRYKAFHIFRLYRKLCRRKRPITSMLFCGDDD